MKSQWFGDKQRYEFAKRIHEADYSQQPYDTFRGFLTCAFLAFRQAVHKLFTGELNPQWEEEVIKEQKRVKHPEKYGEALGILTLALEERSYDFLGTFLSEMDMNDKRWKGQLFTPDPLAQLMGQITVGDRQPEPGRTLTLSEPACGGGAIIIGTSEVLKGNGFFPWDYYWTGVDVDWKCCAMAYIQTTLLGIPATIIHGNYLSLEEWDSFTTLVGALHPPKNRQPPPPISENQKLGRWIIGRKIENGRWICQCDCGQRIVLEELEIPLAKCSRCKF